MNRAISWLQSVRLRQIITVFMVALTFTVSTAFNPYSNAFQAQAEPVTPEADNYQIDRTDSQIRLGRERSQNPTRISAKDTTQNTENEKESTRNAGKSLIQNVREKLNLDEPIDPGTKQTFEQIRDKSSQAVNAPKEGLKAAADRVGTDRNK